MSRFYFETDPPSAEPAFGGPADVLVYFLSLAFSTRYGSTHPLSQLAILLRAEHKINITPLTTFADRDVEEPADERELQRAWQEAGPLAAMLAQVNNVLASGDERIARLLEDTPELPARLRDLERAADAAAAAGSRVRMTFEL